MSSASPAAPPLRRRTYSLRVFGHEIWSYFVVSFGFIALAFVGQFAYIVIVRSSLLYVATLPVAIGIGWVLLARARMR